VVKLITRNPKYINANLNTDLHITAEKISFPEVSMQEIVQQIKGKQVAEKNFLSY
jgi:hypothetical protein